MARELVIVHFNDIYNVAPRQGIEPVGGAARFCAAVKGLQHLQPLVLFSGDAFSPSMCECTLNLLDFSFFYCICVCLFLSLWDTPNYADKKV